MHHSKVQKRLRVPYHWTVHVHQILGEQAVPDSTHDTGQIAPKSGATKPLFGQAAPVLLIKEMLFQLTEMRKKSKA